MRRGHITNNDGTEEGSRIGILRDDYEWFRSTFAPGVAKPPFGMMLHRLKEALEITLTDEMIEDLRMNWAIDDANWEHKRKHMVLDATNREHWLKRRSGGRQ